MSTFTSFFDTYKWIKKTNYVNTLILRTIDNETLKLYIFKRKE